MEQLQQIIEEANKKLVIAKLNGDWVLMDELNMLIAETQALLKGLEDAD